MYSSALVSTNGLAVLIHPMFFSASFLEAGGDGEREER